MPGRIAFAFSVPLVSRIGGDLRAAASLATGDGGIAPVVRERLRINRGGANRAIFICGCHDHGGLFRPASS